jgi:hypothetical protein
MSNIIPFDQIQSMAVSVVKSGFFGAVKTEAQAMTLMLIAQADGIHPIRAAMEYDIIGGKPAPKATTVLARFQESGGSVLWIESNDKKAVAKFSHPKGGEITITWTIDRAQKAELLKNDTWKKFPDQMLRARCIPEGVRAIYPACLSGMYTADEVMDMQATVTPLAVADDTFIEIEVEETPKTTLKAEKIILGRKLQDLQLSNSDIKAFVAYYGIAEDTDAIEALNQDENALLSRVKEFENQQQNQGE